MHDLDTAIVELVSRGAIKIPPYPAVALRVEELVRRQDYGLSELTRIVAADQVMAADALRCANSAFYSRGSSVTSLNAAITRIGAQEVVRLALASGLGIHARKPGPLSSLKRRVWLEALSSAALSQELARKRGLPTEEAFVCGLLHDFGKMIGIACIEEILHAQKYMKPRPLETWIEIIDRYHIELGIVLATQWQLPQLVSDVISLHHEPEHEAAESPAMIDLVSATDEVVALLGEHSWLTPEDLGAISALTADECDLVSRVLDKLPGFIASFEGGAAMPMNDPGAIEKKAPDQFTTGPKAVDFPVTVTWNREVRSYRATHIATSNLTVNGPAALPENVLLELKLDASTPISCWATAKLSWPESGGYTVLLQPFALSGPIATLWKQLVRPEGTL